MVVDFELKRVAKIRAATVSWKGPWKEGKIRSEFERVAAWAKTHGMRTGRWILSQPSDGRFLAAVEVSGKGSGDKGVRVRTLAASRVACVCFDPEAVSPRIVYHGLNDWLRWRKKDKTIKAVGAYREVYAGNPWVDKKAWANTEVQALVR